MSEMRNLKGQFVKTDEVDRFWSKVKKTNGCWIWLGGTDKDGYGTFSVNRVNQRAHRYSYMLAGNTLTDDQILCHTCDVPGCINPDHLFPGTHQDNATDRKNKGRYESISGKNHYYAKTLPKERRRGEQHSMVRINEKQAKEVKVRLDKGEMATSIARSIGVPRHIVYNIKYKTAWSWL